MVCHRCGTALTITRLEPLEIEVQATTHAVRDKPKLKSVEVPCPKCDDFICIDSHVREGFQVKCSNCHAMLEVISTDPLELEVPLKTSVRGNFSLYDDDEEFDGRRGGRSWR
ncbi:MAG: hypothetical protein Kow0031_18620 [Anaerolineae bacterium]